MNPTGLHAPAAVWATTPALTVLDQADGSQIAYHFTRPPAAKPADQAARKTTAGVH